MATDAAVNEAKNRDDNRVIIQGCAALESWTKQQLPILLANDVC